ncbi:MAG: hypothetical protein J0H23_00450 [Micrococcales bacterium]|nr:hypothetical protein [Micrococcales bacterium]OJX66811.1 MAG: PEP phosphonomutase [Micrococcales bacterium 72-143]
MTPRLLDCSASDLAEFGKTELLDAIRASEGRTLVCEIAVSTEPVLVSVSNAELVASVSADIILLNLFDVLAPSVEGLPEGTAPGDVIREIKRLTGRAVGINLEPTDERYAPVSGDPHRIPPGRTATLENAERAIALGADMIVLTGNPGAGVSNEKIAEALRTISAGVGDRVALAAGRMHAAGVFDGKAALSVDDIERFAEAGADILLVPTPGTVPGVTLEMVHGIVAHARARGLLSMTTVGTSQEGADEATMRRLALAAKMAGADIHHLGDAGYAGAAVPESILAYSIAMRGRRHTLTRMARSVLR